MNRNRGRNILCVFILLISLLTAAGVSNAGEGDTERAGDVLLLLIPAAAYGTAFFLDDESGKTQFYRSFLTNLGVTLALKFSIDKERPDGSDNRSFPSLHASATFQGAAFIQKRYGWRYAIPAYAGAAFTGYSRVHARRHYVVDVAAGAAIGVLSSYWFTTPYGGTVTPVAGGGFYGLAFSKSW